MRARLAASTIVTLLIMAGGAMVPAGAGAHEPMAFVTTNQNPFIQIFHPPWPASPVRPESGRWAAGWMLDVTNTSIDREGRPGERVVLDGETWRASLALAYGISPRFEAGLVIPLVSHQSGIFDGLIRRWHDAFGLSNSRRDRFGDYALEYSYEVDGVARISVSEPRTGIGDIRLSGAWRLAGEVDDRRVLMLRAGVKLPTGDASRLHGSGGTDLSLQLLSTDAETLSPLGATLTWMIGALRLGSGDVLDDLRRDHVAVGSLGIARPVSRNLVLKAQIDAHGPFYDTDIRAIGSEAVQLVVGAGIRLKRGGMIDVGIVENLFTDPTPDFGIHLAWHGLI